MTSRKRGSHDRSSWADSGGCGIFPRRGQGREVHDRLGDTLCNGTARNRTVDRRAADHEGLHTDSITELPRLLKRAGPGADKGTITGIFTVLVDGDDHNEPVADAVRGILDGHIVMERAIAERGRNPAINILKSVSRTMPKSADPAFLPIITRARQMMATYSDMEELVRLGAYRTGSNAEVDEAIKLNPVFGGFSAPGEG